MKFFISSTYQDLKDIRRVAINTIESLTERKTAEISAMEEFPASQKSSGAFCVDQVKDADIVIGIYGYRFGSKYYDGRSMTEIEFDEAAEHGATILAFVAKNAENIAETDQQRFIKNKVHSLGGLCAMFDPDDLEGFAGVLNNSLKEYYGTLEGYNYHSIWDDINDLKQKIEHEDDFPRLSPYGENEEDKALDDIASSAEALLNMNEDLYTENDIVYDIAHHYWLKMDEDSDIDPEVTAIFENQKKELLGNIKKNSHKIVLCHDWTVYGIPNHYTRILMAVNYLKLCRVQRKLLTEVWTEDLRQEVLKIKAFYIDVIENRSGLMD